MKIRGESAGRERPRIECEDYIGFLPKKSGMSAGRERPRIEWEDYRGRKVESLREEKGLVLNGRII